MRALIRVTSKLAMASAIAQKALEASVDDTEAMALYTNMNTAAMAALATFPGVLSYKEWTKMKDKLSQFCDKMKWDHKRLHIHNYLIFSSEQLENVRGGLVAHNADKRKILAIEKLIGVEADIYDKYADKGECPECNIEGIRAHDVWDKIFNS